MKFIKRVPDDMFSSRDYWDLNGFTVMVIDDEKIVSITVKKDRNNYTEKVLNILRTNCDYSYITKGYGIDAVFIECPKDKINDVLTKIEDICKNVPCD